MTFQETMVNDLDIFLDSGDFAETLKWTHGAVEKEILGIVDIPSDESSPHEAKIETTRMEAKVKSSDITGITRNDLVKYNGTSYYVYRMEVENPGFTILFLSKDQVYADA